jgi:coenzyme F420-0:L-glutamate ligase/coenzyme F420-1:gamma-L-glutamate ligase
MQSKAQLEFIGLQTIPLISPGDNLVEIILSACNNEQISIQDNDIIVITQKIVSKVENRFRHLHEVKPGFKAKYYAFLSKKDPRFIQLVLDESTRILRVRKGTIISEHKKGFICANAGIDHSNVYGNNTANSDRFLLLPKDPDISAKMIRERIEKQLKKKIGVLIIDSHGRAWRNGTIGMAVGISGLPGLLDMRGREDLFGFKLRITTIGVADEIAAGASLLMGQARESIPVVILRGFPYDLREGCIQELIRSKKKDLFR